MSKEDAWQGIELKSDGFRQWTVTGKGLFYRFPCYLLKRIIFDPILTFVYISVEQTMQYMILLQRASFLYKDAAL